MTDEQMTFFRAFEADMRRILKSEIKQMQMKRNHFEESGFFELNDGRIWYFNTGDQHRRLERDGAAVRHVAKNSARFQRLHRRIQSIYQVRRAIR